MNSITGRAFRAAANMSASRWKMPAPTMPTSRAATRGMAAMMKMMEAQDGTPPFAPPFLKAGKLVIGQTANILFYLGSRHGLAPKAEAGRLWVHQLQLTVTDFVVEIHDTHHPLGAVALLRGPEGAGEKAHRGILERARAEISRIFRAAAADAMAAPISPAAG